MAFKTVLNTTQSLSVSERAHLIREMDALRAELDNLRSEYASLLAKLDADSGVNDTNYAATCGLAAAQFVG